MSELTNHYRMLLGLEPVGKSRALGSACAQPVQVLVCPSRRGAGLHPYVHPVDFINVSRPKAVARTDYAACAGDKAPDFSGGKGRGPKSFAQADSPAYVWRDSSMKGMVFRRSRITLADIRGGQSNKYLVGEKYLARASYFTGKPVDDDQNMLVGFDVDTLRTTDPSYPPMSDEPSTSSSHSFGSAHPVAFNMALADGSVQSVSYSIDREVHRVCGHRVR